MQWCKRSGFVQVRLRINLWEAFLKFQRIFSFCRNFLSFSTSNYLVGSYNTGPKLAPAPSSPAHTGVIFKYSRSNSHRETYNACFLRAKIKQFRAGVTRATRYFDLNESIYLRKFSEIIQKELLKICYRTGDTSIIKITGIRTHELCLFLHPTFLCYFLEIRLGEVFEISKRRNLRLSRGSYRR